MVKKNDIGGTLSSSMFDIMQSKEHKRLFKIAKEKCCSCTGKCADNCPCKGKCSDCSDCSHLEATGAMESLYNLHIVVKPDDKKTDEKEHVHDDKCGCNDLVLKASVLNEVLDLFSKISILQDEFGLNKSATATLKALATMVAELKPEDDTNDIRWSELIAPLKEDTEQRREWWLDAHDHPEIVDLLKQRIEESHEGIKSDPVDYLTPDAHVDTIPPEFESADTELPPESIAGRMNFPQASNAKAFWSHINPAVPNAKEREETPTVRPTNDNPTIPVKGAAEQLEAWLKKQGQFIDEDDFEDESLEDAIHDWENNYESGTSKEDEDLDPSALDLEELSNSEEWDDFPLENPSIDQLFPLEDEEEFMPDDEGSVSDVPNDLESLLEKYDDSDSGLTYTGPAKKYPIKETRFSGPGYSSSFDDLIRQPGGEWLDYEDLTPEEKLELEMNAGLHERLDIDPDALEEEPAAGFLSEDEEAPWSYPDD